MHDRYQSEGERQIARLLERHKIPFLYEHPLAVIDRGKPRLWYPDFTLPSYGIIIEYSGVNNKPGYDARQEHKRALYREMGLPALFLSSESFKGPWPERLLGTIEVVLKSRLRDFGRRRQSPRRR